MSASIMDNCECDHARVEHGKFIGCLVCACAGFVKVVSVMARQTEIDTLTAQRDDARAALADGIAILELCAAGREEYARGAPADQAEALRVEAGRYRFAAAIMKGDHRRALHVVPSWMWPAHLEPKEQG